VQITVKIAEVRTVLLNRRAARMQRRRLADELAAFVTPAERAELDSMLGRHTLEETREIRDILNHQELSRQRSSHSVGLYRGR
jgi:hypothetical protein